MPFKSAKALLFAVLLAAGFALPACNTVEGFGKDLSKLGDKITEADISDDRTILGATSTT